MTTLDFHPTVSVLASGSKDCTIRLFDYSKPSVKRAYRVIQEVAPIRCIYFHPSGDFMVVGTQQSTCTYELASFLRRACELSQIFLVRLYDITTLQCFVSSDARDQHSGIYRACSALLHTVFYYTCVYRPCTSLDYSLDGKLYTTSSKDGCIKVGGVFWWHISSLYISLTYCTNNAIAQTVISLF